MDNIQDNNSELFISSDKIKSCHNVANFFRKLKISCSVTENYSSVPTSSGHKLEKGCLIRINNHSKDTINPVLWNNLKDEFGLGCAYLHVNGKYKGCIYDYFTPSVCPGNKYGL